MADYPRVWGNVLFDSADRYEIAGEEVKVFNPNATSMVVVFAEGGPLYMGKKPDREGQERRLVRCAAGNQREVEMLKLEEAGLMAEVDREDWPEWLSEQINRHLGPS